MGIDMAKEKFGYCAMDRDLNILCTGSNKKNSIRDSASPVSTLKAIRDHTRPIAIGMESTGIYHLPLYSHLRNAVFHVRS